MFIILCTKEFVLQRERHEQQLQRVRSLLAKSQAESALAVFELREENHRLAKENKTLIGKLTQ